MFESGFERAFFVGIALLAAASCGRARRVYVAHAAEPGTRVVRIGSFASLTGPDAATGADYQHGFERAIERWNADGTKRVRVELVSYDDQSRPSASAAAVQRLLADDRVAVVAAPRNPRLDQKRTTPPEAPIVCASCPADATQDVIGLAPSYAQRAELLADLVITKMRSNTVAILARADSASDRAAGDAFRASLKARGVTTDEPLLFTPETIADVLAKLASRAPQAVLVALDGNEAALVGRALRRRAVPSALLFFGTPNLAVLPEADRVAALEGAIFPLLCSSNDSGPVLGGSGDERSVLGFDALWRVCLALEAAADGHSQALRDALARASSRATLLAARVEHGSFVLPSQH